MQGLFIIAGIIVSSAVCLFSLVLAWETMQNDE